MRATDRPRDYILGLDLGQAADYTALAVLERKEKSAVITAPGKPDRIKKSWHFGCRGLKRWPLGTPYPAIVADVEKLTAKPPLAKADLVIDGTGVGRPVVDMFRQARISVTLVPVMITAGSKESHQDGYYHVAKTILISTLQVLLQQRRLQFARILAETPALVKELQDYQVKVTQAANEVFNAREGAHDDLLLALALACWQGDRRLLGFPGRSIGNR
jgi:hypothetical protein